MLEEKDHGHNGSHILRRTASAATDLDTLSIQQQINAARSLPGIQQSPAGGKVTNCYSPYDDYPVRNDRKDSESCKSRWLRGIRRLGEECDAVAREMRLKKRDNDLYARHDKEDNESFSLTVLSGLQRLLEEPIRVATEAGIEV